MLTAVFALFSCLSAAEIELAKNGKTAYTIVTPDNPPQLERLAASDLKHFLKQVTGADFKVVTNSKAPAANRIFVGMAGQAAKLAKEHKLVIICTYIMDECLCAKNTDWR